MKINMKSQVKRSSLKLLASLACFTAGSGGLWGGTYYVTQGAESGTPTTNCPSSGDYSNCGNSSNTCCTFLDAVQIVNTTSAAGVESTIFIPPGGITYSGDVTGEYYNVTGYAILSPASTSGEVVNFNGHVDASGYGAIMQALYSSSASPGVIELDGVILQNTAGTSNVQIAGGDLRINGTRANSEVFTNINWGFAVFGGRQPTLDFTTSSFSDYTVPFTGVITVGAGQDDTLLVLTNNTGSSTVTLSGNVVQGASNTGAILSIYPTSGDLDFTGDITLPTVNINNSGTGDVTFAGVNSIESLNLYGNALIVSGTTEVSTAMNVLSDTTLTTSGTLDVTGSVIGGSGVTLSLAGAGVKSIGTVEVDSGNIFTIAGIINGTTQDLHKTGGGALILPGTSAYPGTTYVDAGVLIVTGDITSSSSSQVAVGALLSGTGTVGNTAVSGGIKGGNPLGTLLVDGTLDLNDGSSFGTLITPGNVSEVEVSGNVTIGDSTLVIAFHPGTYDKTSTVILTGGNISGEFTGVEANSVGANFLTANLTYSPTTVTLGLIERSVVVLATGGNAIQVANALDGAIAFNRSEVSFTISSGPTSSGLGVTLEKSGITIEGSPTPQLADVLASLLPFTEEKTMTYALNQLHPAQIKGMAIVQENNAVRVRESLSQRLLNDLDVENCQMLAVDPKEESTCCEKEKKVLTVWIGGLGDTLKQSNENNTYGPLTGYRANTGGFVTGFDAMFADICYAGALGGYTASHLHFENEKGTGDISSGYAGVYFSVLGHQKCGAGFLGSLFFANASVIGSWSTYSAERHIEYGSVNLTAKNSHGGAQLLTHLDTGLNFNVKGFSIRPFDSFDYMTQTEEKYSEHNAGEWELTVHSKNAIMIRNELGLQFAKCYCTTGSKWTFSPKLSWVREVRIKGDSFSVNFTQGGTSFKIHGYFPDRSLIAPGLSVTGVMLQDALVFDLYYNGEFTGGYSSNSVGGQIGYSF